MTLTLNRSAVVAGAGRAVSAKELAARLDFPAPNPSAPLGWALGHYMLTHRHVEVLRFYSTRAHVKALRAGAQHYVDVFGDDVSLSIKQPKGHRPRSLTFVMYEARLVDLFEVDGDA